MIWMVEFYQSIFIINLRRKMMEPKFKVGDVVNLIDNQSMY